MFREHDEYTAEMERLEREKREALKVSASSPQDDDEQSDDDLAALDQRAWVS